MIKIFLREDIFPLEWVNEFLEKYFNDGFSEKCSIAFISIKILNSSKAFLSRFKLLFVLYSFEIADLSIIFRGLGH